MSEVIIYTKQVCPYCQAAKALFNQKKIAYKEIDVGNNPDLRQEMSEKYNWRTVPMIVINGEFIGGFDDLSKLDQTGKLMEKL